MRVFICLVITLVGESIALWYSHHDKWPIGQRWAPLWTGAVISTASWAVLQLLWLTESITVSGYHSAAAWTLPAFILTHGAGLSTTYVIGIRARQHVVNQRAQSVNKESVA